MKAADPALEAAQVKRLKELYLFLHPETKKGATGKYRDKSQVSQIAEPENEGPACGTKNRQAPCSTVIFMRDNSMRILATVAKVRTRRLH
jgi:hypothetical protein